MNLITTIRNLFVSPVRVKIKFFILLVTAKQDCKSILLNSGFESLGLIQDEADKLLFSAILENDIGYLVLDSKDKVDLHEFIYEHFGFGYKRKYSKHLFKLVDFEKDDTIYLLRGGNQYEFELFKKY